MAFALTETATILCSHGGKVTIPATQHILTVNGLAVLVQGDEAGGSVAGCTNVNAAIGQKPCTKPLPATAGFATKLQVGGKPVLLQSATGQTDSSPPGTWQVVSAGQTKLDTI